MAFICQCHDRVHKKCEKIYKKMLELITERSKLLRHNIKMTKIKPMVFLYTSDQSPGLEIKYKTLGINPTKDEQALHTGNHKRL